jgi:hypothetical protein
MILKTEFDSKIRKKELEIQKKEEKQKDESEAKNRNFTQTYPKGWQRIRELSKGNPGARGVERL